MIPTRLKSVLFGRESALLVLLVALAGYFSAAIPGFADPQNVMDRSRHLAEIAMIAVPMTLIIATGGIDLSVASILAMSGMVGAGLWQHFGLNLWAAMSIAVLVGTMAGAVNGVLSVALRLSPLVVTLATMAAYRGIAMIVTQAPQPVGGFPESFSILGGGEIPGTIVPWQWIPVLIAVISGIVLLNRSWVGSYALGMGENPTAALFAGVPVRGLTVFLYALSGFWCGIAAPIYLSFNQTALPEMKRGMELDVIAAVVVGGTRITGGQASVVGSFLGVLLLGTLQYGMQMHEPAVPQSVQDIVTGLLVIFAAVFNEIMARREERMQTVG